MKKILLLLLLINSSLMAVTQYTILVNTAQEVPMYAELFDAIHLFFHGTTGQNYLSLLKLIVMFGTIVTVVRATTAISVGVGQGGNDGAGGHSSLVGLASYQIFIVAMLMILYGRESQLIVKHPNSLRTEFTATVPEIFGYTVSFFSQLNYKMVEIAEEAFSNLRSHGTGTAYDPATANKNISYGLTGLGYGGLSSNLANISSITADKLTYLDGTDVKTIGPKLRVYGKDCVVMPLSNSNSDALGAIMNNNGSIVDNISPANMLANWGIDSSSYLTTYNGATTTCTDFWTSDLKPALDLAADNMYVRYGKEMAALFYTMKISNIVDPANDGGSNGMIGDVISMQNQIFNAGIGNTFNGIFSDLGTTGNVFAAGMQQNLMEQNMMNWGIGRAMAEYLPVFASFLFMIMIAAFPFMFAFSLMPGGISIMVNFVKTLAWISLWAPMSAILNFFMDYRLTEHIIEKTGSGTLNLVDGVSANFQLFDITSEAAMMANLAGGLYVMVPALSWMLVTGSGTMLTGITSGLASSVAGAMNMDKLQQTAEDIKTQETLDSQGIGYSERKHYEMSNRVAAQASSSMATKAAYGGAGGALTDVMAHDMGVAGATQMASQRAFGANTTMAQAAAGGEFQGAMKAGNVNGQALALSSYDNKTGDVARTGAMESFGSAMASKGKTDQMNFSSMENSSYNAGAREGSNQHNLGNNITKEEAIAAGVGDAKLAAEAISQSGEYGRRTSFGAAKLSGIKKGSTAAGLTNGVEEQDKIAKAAGFEGIGDMAYQDSLGKSADEAGDMKESAKNMQGGKNFGARAKAAAYAKRTQLQTSQRMAKNLDEMATKQNKEAEDIIDDAAENDAEGQAAATSAKAKNLNKLNKNGTKRIRKAAEKAAMKMQADSVETWTNEDGSSTVSEGQLYASAKQQGGQAAGAMKGQAEQLAKTYNNNKSAVIADAQTNTGFQISSSHAEARGHRDVSGKGNDFSGVRKGQEMMAANSDSKMASLGRNGSVASAIASGANDGAQMAGDQNADAFGDYKRTESKAHRIGAQARRFKNAADMSDSLAQSKIGTGELGNYVAVQSQNKIVAPIKANNESMADIAEKDQAEALVNSKEGKALGIKDVDTAMQYNRAVKSMTKSQQKGEIMPKHSKEWDGAITELGEDTRDAIFSQTAATHGNSDAIQAIKSGKGNVTSAWLATSSSSAVQTMSGMMMGGAIASNSGAIGGASGFVGFSNVQAASQISQIAGQDQSQRVALAGSNASDSFANRSSTMSALNRDVSQSQTMGQLVETRNAKSTGEAAAKMMEQMSPEKFAEMKAQMGSNSGGISLAAAMNATDRSSSFRTVTSDGYSHSMTVGANGSVGTNNVSGQVGINIQGNMNYDYKTITGASIALESGAGEETLQTMAIGTAVAADAATVALGQSRMLNAAAKAVSANSGGAVNPNTGAVSGSSGRAGNLSQNYLNKTNKMGINSQTLKSQAQAAGRGQHPGGPSGVNPGGNISEPPPVSGNGGYQSMPDPEDFMFVY